MGNWNSIQQEIDSLNRPEASDIVRRQKINAVQRLTGRHLLIYAVDFTNPIKAQLANNLMLISLPDKDGFDEVTRGLPQGSGLDILLHSPGGSALILKSPGLAAGKSAFVPTVKAEPNWPKRLG